MTARQTLSLSRPEKGYTAWLTGLTAVSDSPSCLYYERRKQEACCCTGFVTAHVQCSRFFWAAGTCDMISNRCLIDSRQARYLLHWFSMFWAQISSHLRDRYRCQRTSLCLIMDFQLVQYDFRLAWRFSLRRLACKFPMPCQHTSSSFRVSLYELDSHVPFKITDAPLFPLTSLRICWFGLEACIWQAFIIV